MKRPFPPELPEQSMSQPENGVLRRRRGGVGYEEGSVYEEVFRNEGWMLGWMEEKKRDTWE